MNSGDDRRAMQFFEQAMVIYREVGDRKGEGLALWNMSLLLYKLGKHAQAIEHGEQSLMIREQIEDPNAAKVRAQLAAWRRESGHH
jgi:tetratricopeptide (TPR) repeat protein